MRIKEFFTSEKYTLLSLFIFALVIRVLYVIRLSPSAFSPDGGDWIHIATGIVNGMGYGGNWRSPVYPFFLAAVFFFKAGSILLVRIAQALVDSFTCIVIYFIAKRIFDRRAGMLAALLTALYPYFIYNTGDILKETLFTFLISLSILLFYHAIERDRLILKIAAGISFGLSVLCKSTILPFYMSAFIWYIAFHPPQIQIKDKIRGALVIFSFMLLTIAPWTIRNYFHYHHFVLVETHGPMIFWQANNPVDLVYEDIPDLDVQRLPDEYADCCNTAELNEVLKLPQFEGDKVFMRKALSFIRDNRSAYITLLRKRFFHYWRLFPRIATKRNKLIAKLTSGWILPFGWLGIILAWKKYWRKTGLLVLLLASFTCVHIVFWAMIRYRVPIDPFVIIFCSYTLIWIYDRTKASVTAVPKPL